MLSTLTKIGYITTWHIFVIQLHIVFLYHISYNCYIVHSLIDTLHASIGFTIHTKLFCFSKLPWLYKYLNQYQTYLYLFECISHGDSKYSHQIPECWHFLKGLRPENIFLFFLSSRMLIGIGVSCKSKFM